MLDVAPSGLRVAGSSDLGALLRGEAGVLHGWIAHWNAGRTWQLVLIIVVGAGAFGGAMGSWRAAEQGLWSAVKLPLVLVATAAGNALINGMLAPLLGVDLRLMESFGAVLTSFALAAAIMGAFSPVMLFLNWNLPAPMVGVPVSGAARHTMLLMLVAVIALAGVAANVRLLQLLRRTGGGKLGARKLLFAWLAVNLLLGSQLSWNARPFIGKADTPVRFLSPQAFQGNFFEEVGRSARELYFHLSR